MTTYTDPFGGSSVQPADVSYRAATLSADVTLSWPRFAVDANYLARIMAITASSGGLSVTLPDARAASTGEDVIFTNPGANTYTVKNNAGATVCTVAAGVSQYVYLTDNSTAGGTWSTVQFGSLASAVTAASLVGPGIGASGATLYGKLAVSSVSASFTSTTADRAKLFVWTGGIGTLTLPLSSAAGSDYYFAVSNRGSGSITVTRAGADTIDGSTTLVLGIGESCYLASDGSAGWYTIGRGRSAFFNFTQLSKAISTGTVTLTLAEAQNVVQKYTGVLVGNVNVVLPSTVQVYYVSNQTSGAFSVTFKTSGVGTTVVVPTGQNAVLFCDGVNVLNASTTVSGISSLTLSPGSVSVPSINFSTGASTGIYSSASDVFNIATAGVKRVEVSATGNFGIGGVPTAKLHVFNTTGELLFADNGDGTILQTASTSQSVGMSAGGNYGAAQNASIKLTPGASRSIGFNLNSVQVGVFDSSGNFGIGKTPSLPLDVAGNASFGQLAVVASNSGVNSILRLGQSGVVNWDFKNVATTGLLQITNGSVTPVTIDGSGALGVGRTPSGVAFDFQAAGAAILRIRGGTSAGQGAAVYFTAGSDTSIGAIGEYAAIYGGTLQSALALYTTGYLSLGANGAEKARIDTGGRLLLNRTADSGLGLLQVSDTTGAIADFASSFAGTSLVRIRNSGVQATGITLQNSLTGTTSSDGYQLLVDGSANAYIAQNENASLFISTNSTTRLTLAADGTFTHTVAPGAIATQTFQNTSNGFRNNLEVKAKTAGGADVTIRLAAEGDGPDGLLQTTTNHNLIFGTNNVARMTLDTSGFLTMSSSGAQLTIQSTSASAANLVLKDSNTIDSLIIGSAGQSMYFQMGGLIRARFDANGNFGLGVTPTAGQGLIQLAASATSGIKLGNTNNTNATTLDWYEEGTFTPATSLTGTPTYTTQTGTFQRVGNRVNFTIALAWTGGTNGASFTVTGLPYTAASPSVAAVLLNESNTSFSWTGTPLAVINGGTTNISIQASASAGTPANILNPNAGTKDLRISGFFFV